MSEHTPIVERLRTRGERITVQRRMVIAALQSTHDHMTIQDIASYLAQQPASADLPEPTIYRIVQWLKDQAVVSQTDMGERGVVYQIIGEQRHHHLICLRCGGVEEVDDGVFDGLRATLREQQGFRARMDHMAIYGLCAACGPDMQQTKESDE